MGYLRNVRRCVVARKSFFCDPLKMRMPIEKLNVPFFALDPGVRGCGLAYFTPAAGLWAAWYVECLGASTRGAAALAMAQCLRQHLRGYSWGAAVVEWPVQREGAGAFANRTDITELTAVAACCGAVFAEGCTSDQVAFPLPEEWKGQTPKHILQARIVGAVTAQAHLPRIRDYHSTAPGTLDATAQARIKWTTVRSKNCDIADAVALGLRYMPGSR